MREGGSVGPRGRFKARTVIDLPDVPLCAFSLSAVHKNRESLLLLSLERKCHRVRASAANFFRKLTVNHTGFTSRWYKTLRQPVRKTHKPLCFFLAAVSSVSYGSVRVPNYQA